MLGEGGGKSGENCGASTLPGTLSHKLIRDPEAPTFTTAAADVREPSKGVISDPREEFPMKWRPRLAFRRMT